MTQTVLQAAIETYNRWAEKGARYYDPVKAYSELRGIFYNKLIALAKDHTSLNIRPHHRWRHRTITLNPSDLICQFDERAMLVSVGLESWVDGKIKDALGAPIKSYAPVATYTDPFYNVIDNIVNQIVNYKI